MPYTGGDVSHKHLRCTPRFVMLMHAESTQRFLTPVMLPCKYVCSATYRDDAAFRLFALCWLGAQLQTNRAGGVCSVEEVQERCVHARCYYLFAFP